ncbi:MAG: DUF192 domain-containing protein [Endomicrobium sp.]|uniref:DUF192 domain-containing protein n=1 Tax=Candidatus Endomicrobiellum cubanum TaxID=3242325 RepID=UPI002828BC31|nr:DUF192 domain-containing protein [Endomicrobium sp.]
MEINIEIKVAKTFFSKFLGFMFKKDANYALLFKNCKSIHTFFMRFNLDIIFLDKENKVVKIVKNIRPFRIILPVKNSFSILEIPSNIAELKDIMISDILLINEISKNQIKR